jgi:phosphoglucomutase
MKPSPLAGKSAPAAMHVNVPRLVTPYYIGVPDLNVRAQRVAFGTSGHRGSSFDLAFNEWHIFAITQAICHYRKSKNVADVLYLGIDTHPVSVPAGATPLDVLAGRRSATENMYKTYAESFQGEYPLNRIQDGAQLNASHAIAPTANATTDTKAK